MATDDDPALHRCPNGHYDGGDPCRLCLWRCCNCGKMAPYGERVAHGCFKADEWEPVPPAQGGTVPGPRPMLHDPAEPIVPAGRRECGEPVPADLFCVLPAGHDGPHSLGDPEPGPHALTYSVGRADGERIERARIVAWLRTHRVGRNTLGLAADRIERDEHIGRKGESHA
jgi:hypothetical protein